MMKRYLLKRQVLVLVFSLISFNLFPQTFVEQTSITLPGVSNGSIAWGDYDNDDNIDLLIAGAGSDNFLVFTVFRNNGDGSFSEQTNIFSPELPNIYVRYNCSAKWVDFDNDGYLDILYNGPLNTGGNILVIFKNEGNNVFTQQANINYWTWDANSVDCGDYDNDGDQDILFTTNVRTRVFQNQSNFEFTEQFSISINGTWDDLSNWIDYDNDGDLDIFMSSMDHSWAAIYQNQGNNFFILKDEFSFGLTGKSADWGDYDNNGFFDLILTGYGNTRIYKNTSDNFTYQSDILLSGVRDGTGKWGDLDNDGDLDFILSGNTNGSYKTTAYINNGNNIFSEQTDIVLDGVYQSSVEFCDYDNDNDLDILIAGNKGTTKICKVFRNESSVTNLTPEIPAGLTSEMQGAKIILKWNPVLDDNTPSTSITYNIMVGTASGGVDVVNPNSSSSGFRKIPVHGNGQLDTTFILKNIKKGTYYWKVQAVDNCYSSSSFSSESSFIYSEFNQAFGLNVPEAGGKEATLLWSRGNGDSCIVFVKEGNNGVALPVNSTSYSASNIFGSGSQISSSGWYCVYNGTEDSIHIVGLNTNTEYLFQVIEYDGGPGAELYNNVTSVGNPYGFRTGIFTEISNSTLLPVTSISNLGKGTDCFWMDFDNDNDLDVFLLGEGNSYLYRNDGNDIFTLITTSLSGGNSAACGDYNNDDHIDVIINNGTNTIIFANNGDGTFTEQTSISIIGGHYGSVDLGDYDNDGDLDIIVTGESYSVGNLANIYRNNGDNSFTDLTTIPLPKVRFGLTKWGDYDNDGFLDILLSGITVDYTYITKVFRNNRNNNFIEKPEIELNNAVNGAIEWGDYDSDGDLDILIISDSESLIYRNEGNDLFSPQTNISLSNLSYSSGIWGDYNNDGYLDVALSGYKYMYIPTTELYSNNGDNTFSKDTTNNLINAGSSSIAWGDYDNDGDLDLLIIGNSLDKSFTKIYRNDIATPNIMPEAPTGSISSVNKSDVELIWESVRSDITDYKTMSYNIKVGKGSQGIDVVSPHSSSNGYRRLASMGNGNLDTTFYLKNLPFDTYYWSVQAVDNGFAGGAFSAEGSFSIVPVQATDLAATIIDNNSLLIKWERGNGSRCVIFCKQTSFGVSTPVDYKSYIADNEFGYGEQLESTGWYCVYNGRSDSVIVTGLTFNTEYSFHVIEYLGAIGDEQYFTEIVNGNPGVFSTGLFAEQTEISLPSAYQSKVAWGDYDNDGFADIIIPSFPSRIYRNNGDNTFIEQTGTLLTDIAYGDAAWGDYDNDGDLDLLIAGATISFPASNPVTKIYRNDGSNIFTEQTQILLDDVYYSTVNWGDYDNDGDLDILITGATTNDPNYDPISKIYKNNGDGTFTHQEQMNLTGVFRGSSAWGDYDNDGDLDILICGATDYQYYTNAITKVYRNNGNNTFTDQTEIQLDQVYDSSVDWGDYDNDGDLDILMTSSGHLYMYQNTGNNSFEKKLSLSFSFNFGGYAVWGDYNNDGYLDILFTNHGAASQIYENLEGNSFLLVDEESFKITWNDNFAWCDYDNDGDLDVLASIYGSHCSIYKNNLINESGIFSPNTSPHAPNNPLTDYSPDGVTLKWNKVNNDETTSNAMTYNVRIGTTKDSTNICPSHADLTGFRNIATMGNAQLDTTFFIKNLASRKYYWSVQAVDQSFAGGPWSVVDSFEVKNVQAFFSFDTVCMGFPTHFTDQSVATDGIDLWTWNFGDGIASSEQNPTHIFENSGTHQVKLLVQSAEFSDSIIQEVLVKPKPLTEFSTDIACQGASTNIINNTTINGTNVTDWYWDFGDGESSTLQDPLSHGYLNPGDYNVKLAAYADNGCSDSIQNIATVAEYPVAAITASSPFGFCSGDSVILSVDYDENYLYTWKIGAANITGGDSSRYTAKISGVYSVEVVNNTGNCTTLSSDADVIVLDAPVHPFISSDGAVLFCQGDSVILSVTENPDYSYQWKLNGGAIGIDTNIYYAKTSGNYILEVSNSTGCVALSSNSIDVTVNEVPDKPVVSLSGLTGFCEGDSLILSADEHAGLTYQWCNENGEILNADSNQYVTYSSGSFYLDITNSSNCTNTSNTTNVTVSEMPLKPVINTTGYDINDCPQEKIILLSVDQPTVQYDYQWKRNGVPIDGETGSSIEDYLKEGDYSVIADNNGCANESDITGIYYDPELPEKPGIIATGPNVWYLACTNDKAQQYEWYYNNEIISGANNYLYVANQTLGTYFVKIAEENGCFVSSDAVTIPLTATGIDDVNPFAGLKIYPNPTPGMFTIEMDNNLFGELITRIFSQNAVEILNIKFEKSTQHFIAHVDLSGQGKGVYLISFTLDKYKAERKIVVE